MSGNNELRRSNRILGQNTVDPGGSNSVEVEDLSPEDKMMECIECKEKHHCKDVGIDPEFLTNATNMMLKGFRWHCNKCLGTPPNIKSLRNEIDEFKNSVQEEIAGITTRLNSQFESKLEAFQSAFISNFENIQKKTTAEIKSGYAAAASRGIETQAKTAKVMTELSKKVETLKKNVESDL